MSAQHALQEETQAVLEGGSLLDRIIDESRIARSSAEHERARDLIGELVEQVLEGELVPSENLSASLDARVAELDALISAQLSEILHAPEFQRLESAWSGLHYLCRQTSTGENLKIRLLNAGKRELLKDFRRAIDFDQSALFRRFTKRSSALSGLALRCIDWRVLLTRQPEDMYFVEQMSHIAAAAHAPFITAASPELLGLESFTELGRPRDLNKVFDTVEYAKWKSFRESEDARYVGIALPRFLGRLPYNPVDGIVVEGFNFVEEVDGSDHDKYLWCNAAFALGARLTSAFEQYGWCAAIRGVEGAAWSKICRPTLSAPMTASWRSSARPRCRSPTGAKGAQRSRFIALVHCKNTDYAAFFGAQSAQKPRRYDSDAANANSALSSQLQYIFAVCRIAHYMKAMMRDKVGSFASASNVESYLQRWVDQYVTADDSASQETKAQFPLREASVEVAEIAGRPGVYRAVSFIRPHFQLDELSVSLRLVAELPQGTKA